jgi:hypothetical protein
LAFQLIDAADTSTFQRHSPLQLTPEYWPVTRQPQGNKMLDFDSKLHCGSPGMPIKARFRVLEDKEEFNNDK